MFVIIPFSNELSLLNLMRFSASLAGKILERIATDGSNCNSWEKRTVIVKFILFILIRLKNRGSQMG